MTRARLELVSACLSLCVLCVLLVDFEKVCYC
jgi:hypothetical protein